MLWLAHGLIQSSGPRHNFLPKYATLLTLILWHGQVQSTHLGTGPEDKIATASLQVQPVDALQSVPVAAVQTAVAAGARAGMHTRQGVRGLREKAYVRECTRPANSFSPSDINHQTRPWEYPRSVVTREPPIYMHTREIILMTQLKT